MIYKIPVSRPSITDKEKAYLKECIDSGWISSQGPFVERFEKAFAGFTDHKHAVSCSSGTNAIQLAVESLHLSPGDEVIVPEFTMIATAWAVTDAGAIPVFVDCGDDLNIDVLKIEAKITKRTKAIIPVHIYGRQCDMDAIMDIAYEYGLRVIEDSCEAHGIKPRGDIACFSLFANKIFSSGEGGVCVTNDEYLAEQMRHLRGMAFNYAHTFYHKKKAHNFRMTSLQASVALAQVERAKEILDKRLLIQKWYDKGLEGVMGITKMPSRNVLWMYDVLAERRDELVQFLEKEGIETRVFFRPMSAQPMYYNENWKDLNATKFFNEGLYLPTFTDITKQEVDEVIKAIKKFYGK
jgi:dTDP-4-amino-4,6-dideoxygalactose transaminase